MNVDKILTGEDLDIKTQSLRQLKVDKENWTIFFVDEQNDDKWVKEYPNANYHGGGAPQLRLLEYFPWEEKGK
jgi:hypothetical protein